MREDGEPTRRRAPRAEFSDEEWRLVSELADYPNRLLVTVTTEAGETYAEVAHEAIFRRWDKLANGSPPSASSWPGAAASRPHAAPGRRRRISDKNDALLMGFALTQAQSWLAQALRRHSGSRPDFIVAEPQGGAAAELKVQALVGVLVAAMALGAAAGGNRIG